MYPKLASSIQNRNRDHDYFRDNEVYRLLYETIFVDQLVTIKVPDMTILETIILLKIARNKFVKH